MRIKRLEIQGFKSFKDKTVIQFDHSITGIVGPNGCGKSNIVDAFFWVMGEQSYKHMRGSGSDDLIFNGSSKYTPLGMAEATLVMETDVPDTENAPSGATVQDIPVHLRAKEVSVTRRVYRTGEGEYFINGVPVRLKDVKELFMDTGVGAKGYSVIEQGQIGKVVNAKPEERRLLIEEAAGIAKYKARKTESLRKLEATHGNLSRLNDIIQEIERNLSSLERQAQKARQYRKYKDELLEKEMTWGRRKTKVLRQKLEALQNEREGLEQELVGLKAELQTAENNVEIDRVGQLTESKQTEELQTRLGQLSSELTRAQSALDLSRRRQSDLTSQVESLQSEKTSLAEAIEEEKNRITAQVVGSNLAHSELENAAQSVRASEESIQEARTEAGAARQTLEASKRELLASISQASEMASRSASLKSRAESLLGQVERLESQMRTQEERVSSAQAECARIQGSVEEIRGRRAQLQSDVEAGSLELRQFEQSLKDTEKHRDVTTQEFTKLRSKLQSLEELAAAFEGFGDGPRAALEWAKESDNAEKLKAVVDSIDVRQGYEAALEGWLGSNLENLVSNHPGFALETLDKLQSEKQGRAAILMSDAAGIAANESAADFESVRRSLEAAGFDVLGELRDFVTTPDGIAAKLLANVAVVRSMAPVEGWINGIAGPHRTHWGIVSLDGKALDQAGILRGGTLQSEQAGSILGRKRAIADLSAQMQAAEAAAHEAELAAQAARERLEVSRERLHALKTELQSMDVETAAREREKTQADRATKDAESQLELTRLEAENLRQEHAEGEQERLEAEAKMAEAQSRRGELEARISGQEQTLAEREATLREREEALQNLRINEASLRERASALVRELESARAFVADRERRMAELDRALDRATREQADHSGSDAELESRIAKLTTQINDNQEQLAAAKDRLEQTSARVNSTLDRIKELHNLGNDKTAQSNHLAIEAERVSGEVSHLLQNLEEKYGPGCLDQPTLTTPEGNELSSPIQEEMDEPVVTAEMTAEEEALLGEEVERLRERIRRLGEVNVMAVEEYDEVKKRHDYLLAERTDLETSIQNLQDAIEHINKTSEERFRKAFTAIAERFERLFPIIFGGGSASLTLVYPEGSTDILDAGVDIMAQPPGKKVSNITLLSGGEKALTAVSLIFAIFMVKPSPFCLLDEVDAPLDDANIGKFNALLREMSAKSQFIVITHNKKTMELNDTLYGVTMEEPGVSKMVSIEMH